MDICRTFIGKKTKENRKQRRTKKEEERESNKGLNSVKTIVLARVDR